MKRKLLRCMTVLAALWATSCSSEFILEGSSGKIPGQGVDDEEVEVVFSISAESANAITRAESEQPAADGKGSGAWQPTIGKGKNIDMLIYAVYDEDYTLLSQYGHDNVVLGEYSASIPEGFNNKPGTGQTVVYDPFDKNNTQGKGGNAGSYTFSLRLMRNKTYHLAFWAQSSQTTAYETGNLEKVHVIYANAKNNDELRDAFCKVESFSISPSTPSAAPRSIVLTRPLAQVNVGTTGADYKTRGSKVTHSQITLSGVAQYINVVKDEILRDDLISKENPTMQSITFEYNEIFAVQPRESGASEEYLYVDLNQDKKILNYVDSYPTLDEYGNATTETFKYLSMCYVLVPAAKKSDSDEETASESGGYTDSELPDPYTSTVLESVSVEFSADGADSAFPVLTLTQVPVHRNWRTNILGGLWKEPAKPNDPDDDPTSVFKNASFRVEITPLFDGNYNSEDGGDTWTQDPEPDTTK